MTWAEVAERLAAARTYRVGQLVVGQAADGGRPSRRSGQPEQDTQRRGLADTVAHPVAPEQRKPATVPPGSP